MIIENIKYLVNHHRELREQIKKLDKEENRDPIIEKDTSKTGLPILRVKKESSYYYLHSKYDPMKESERILKKLEDQQISEFSNIIIYGVGMGYHVEKIIEKYPNHNYILIEPNETCFYYLGEERKFSEVFNSNIYKIIVNSNDSEYKNAIVETLKNLDGNFRMISSPSYEQYFKEDHSTILDILKVALQEEKSNLVATKVFEKKWITNSIKNLKYTVNTPDILYQKNKEIFKDKPVIIVSAGPSLSEEIDNLRVVKQKGLAYIFAVGSANKALLKNNIEPDAVCTYDPRETNDIVFEEMILEDINHIPMIYGTTVGYKTLERYKGPKSHMIISQDTVTPNLLYDNIEKVKIVSDAPSIAIVTLQMLCHLEASPIILVGQNLGFKNDEFYAEGIEYKVRNQKLTMKDKEQSITIKDVHGKDMVTNEGFLRMKDSMEMYIKSLKRGDIFNTTNGGAHIVGTEFIPLEKVIDTILVKRIIDEQWHSKLQTFDYLNKAKEKIKLQSNFFVKHKKNVNDLLNTINSINLDIINTETKLEKQLNILDKQINKLENNVFYKTFIVPLMSIERNKIIKVSRKIKLIKNLDEKINKINEEFGKFINTVESNTHYIEKDFKKMVQDFE